MPLNWQRSVLCIVKSIWLLLLLLPVAGMCIQQIIQSTEICIHCINVCTCTYNIGARIWDGREKKNDMHPPTPSFPWLASSRCQPPPASASCANEPQSKCCFTFLSLWSLSVYTHSLCNRSIISFGDCASRPIDMWVAWGQSPLYKNIFRSFVCLILAIQIAPGKEKKERK
jgi:hypothetical protein